MTLEYTPIDALVPEDVVKDIFRRHGIPTTVTALCSNMVEVDDYLRTNRSDSYVLKLSMASLIHKSSVGGVRLDVAPEDVASSFAELVRIGTELEPTYGKLRGVVIEPYVGAGTEAVLGFQVDDGLGPVVMVGDGGTDVEEVRRVVFAAAPLSPASARQLVDRWSRLPESAGRKIGLVARERVADLLIRLAGDDGLVFATDCTSVDINPVIVTGDSVVAVDGVIQSSAEATRPSEWTDRFAASAQPSGNLGAFLDPGSIAFVGASTDPTKPGSVLLQNLLDFGYTGRLYPVHPTASEIAGLKAFPSILDIPEHIEKAIVLVGRDNVPEIVRQCVAKNVDAVQVYSSGFSEYSDAKDIEQELFSALAGSATRMMGPNCWGAYSPRSRITTNAARYSGTESGGVAFLSQSGTHLADVVRRSSLRALPLYGAVSMGNCLDLKTSEFARHLLDQDDVKVLGMYLEGTSDARGIIEMAGRTPKPIVVMRGGRTPQGSRAAASHTAALVGDDAVWASLMIEAGVILVETIEEMMDTLAALATFRPIQGNRLVLFGTGGGVGVTAADVAARNDLVLGEFSSEMSIELSKRFGQPGTSMSNPVDVTVWDLFLGGRSILSEVLSLIAVPDVADSAIAFLELGSILDLNTIEQAAQLVDLLVTDLEQYRCTIPLSLVLRTGGDPGAEELFRAAQRRLRTVGVEVHTRIQDAVTAHARITATRSR